MIGRGAWSVDYTPDGRPFAAPYHPIFQPVDRARYPDAYAQRIQRLRYPVPAMAGLAADEMASMQQELDAKQKLMQRELREQAALTAGAQMGVTVALMCIPVAGWIAAALSAIYSAITALYGQHNARKLRREGDALKERINAYMKARWREVEAAEDRSVDEVWNDAVAMAKSSEPLDDTSDAAVGAATGSVLLAAEDGMPIDPAEAPAEWDRIPAAPRQEAPGINGWDSVIAGNGDRWLIGPPQVIRVPLGLGNVLSQFDKSVRRSAAKIDRTIRHLPVVKQAMPTIMKMHRGGAQTWAMIHVRPVMLAGKVIFGGGAAILRATGDRKHAEKWRQYDKQWERRGKYFIHQITADHMTAKSLNQAIRRGWRVFTSEQQLVGARKKMNEMEATAKLWIDRYVERSIQKVLSPEGKAEMRLALARAIRGDPDAREGYEWLRRREARGLDIMWSEDGPAAATVAATNPNLPPESINLQQGLERPASLASFAAPAAAAAGAAFLLLNPA